MKLNGTQTSPYLTSQEMAASLRVSIRTLKRYVSQGLPVIRVGGYLRFDQQEVLKWFRDARK